MPKGPNNLNLANYLQGQGQNVVYDPKQYEEIMEQESPDLEQLFDNCIKDIQRYDEILNKVRKNINQITNQEYFITDFYPEFVLKTTYQTDQEKKIITYHDVELGKIMENLQRGNKILKQQYKGWLFEFSKKTRLAQVLLTQNKLLRKYTSQKNKDILLLLKTLQNTDNTQISQLNQSLQQLVQQNSILKSHLTQIKQTLSSKQDEQNKIIEAYKRIQKEKFVLENNIKEGQDQEEHYSKQMAILEMSLEEIRKKEEVLGAEKGRLVGLKREFVKDEEIIEKQIEIADIDKKDIEKHLKQKFKKHQQQKQHFINSIQALTQNITQIKNETKSLQQNIHHNESKISEYRHKNSELDKKIEQITAIMETNSTNYKKYKQIQIAQLSNIDMIDFDIEVLKKQISQIEQMQQKNHQKYRKQLKIVQQQKCSQIQKSTKQLNNLQWQQNKRIHEKKTKLSLKKKEIENLQKLLKDKQNQIQYLKLQLLEIKENQKYYLKVKEQLRNQEGK